MTILEKWEAIKSLMAPGINPTVEEEMRRVFYAGVGACWQAILEETRHLSAQETMVVIDNVKLEIDEHQKDLIRKRVLH